MLVSRCMHKEKQHSMFWYPCFPGWYVPWVPPGIMSLLSGIRTWKRCKGHVYHCLQDIANYYFVHRLVVQAHHLPTASLLDSLWTNPAFYICRKRLGVLFFSFCRIAGRFFFWKPDQQRLFSARLAANFLLERNTTAWDLIYCCNFQPSRLSMISISYTLSSSMGGMINPDHDIWQNNDVLVF